MPAPAKFDDLKVFAFPTPGADNFVLRVRRDPSAAKYERLAEGTALADCNFMQMRDTENAEYTGFLLTKIVPVVTEQQNVEDWFFVRPWTEQNDWNWTTKYLDESDAHPLVQRSSVILREDYAVQANSADADPVFENYTLISQEQVRHEDPVIDALFVVAVRTYAPLPGATRPGALKGDLQTALPPEFRREIDVEIEMTKVPTGTAADSGADILESQVIPESVALAEKRTYRNVTEFPIVLVESEITNDGQVATITKTLDEGAQTVTPSATVSGQVDNRGGGITLKTEVEVPEVFDAAQVSAEKPDVIPTAFRASVPAETTVETVAGSSVVMPTLGANDLEKSEQRVTVFTKRVTTTSRDNGDLPILEGQEFDRATGVALPYTEEVVEAGSAPIGDANKEITPLSDDWSLVKSQNLSAIQAALLAVHWRHPGRENVSLPDVLVAVDAVWSKDENDGEGSNGGAIVGSTGASIMGPATVASAEASCTVAGTLSVRVRAGFRGPKPAVYHTFFLIASEEISDAAILSKVGASQWPVYELETERVVLIGGTKGTQLEQSGRVQNPLWGDGESYYVETSRRHNHRGGIDIRAYELPPTLHPAITIGSIGDNVAAASATLAGESAGSANVTKTGTIVPEVLAATSPSSFPNGRFLTRCDVTPYDFGLVRVTAVTVEL
jgi:hypothetical protein